MDKRWWLLIAFLLIAGYVYMSSKPHLVSVFVPNTYDLQREDALAEGIAQLNARNHPTNTQVTTH